MGYYDYADETDDDGGEVAQYALYGGLALVLLALVACIVLAVWSVSVRTECGMAGVDYGTASRWLPWPGDWACLGG